MRATFDFEVDPEQDKAKDDADKLEGLMKVAELTASDPNLEQELAMSNKKLNKGELFAEIISLTSDNDKIVTDIGPEEQQEQQQRMMQDPNADPSAQMAQDQQAQQADEKHQLDIQAKEQDMQMKQEKHAQSLSGGTEGMPSGVDPEEMQANIEAIMEQYGVDENTAMTALAAEHQGFPSEDVINELKKRAIQE